MPAVSSSNMLRIMGLFCILLINAYGQRSHRKVILNRMKIKTPEEQYNNQSFLLCVFHRISRPYCFVLFCCFSLVLFALVFPSS